MLRWAMLTAGMGQTLLIEFPKVSNVDFRSTNKSDVCDQRTSCSRWTRPHRSPPFGGEAGPARCGLNAAPGSELAGACSLTAPARPRQKIKVEL